MQAIPLLTRVSMQSTNLELAMGHNFLDRALLRTALTHSSAGEENNERMEFLGDAVLGFLVSRYLYDIFEGQEGKMTILRSRLVDQKSLARAAKEISLMDHIVRGPSVHEVSEGMLADTMEALIGATYLDGGASSTDEVVRRLLLRPEQIQAALGQKDHITELKQMCDINGTEPCYQVEEVDLPGSKFRATLMLDGQKVEGFGHSKDTARADAAMRMMKRLA